MFGRNRILQRITSHPLAPSSNGLGRSPLKAQIRVRFPLALHVPTRSVSLLSILLAAFLTFSCDPELNPASSGAALSVDDVDVSRAWIRVILTDPVEAPFAVDRNGKTILRIPTAPVDTILLDDSLLPRHQYLYQLSSSRHTILAKTVLTTLDTTSNNFAWEIDTLDISGFSELRDIAIVNDSLVYTCGAIYLRDSLGETDPTPYNLAKWNGTRWDFIRLQFYAYCGQSTQSSYPTSSVLAFNSHDVWVAMDGDQIATWNGTAQTATICAPTSHAIRKIWGPYGYAIYAAGDDGSLLYYSYGGWEPIETGTSLNITDIWGSANPAQILAVASETGENFQTAIVKIDSGRASLISTSHVSSPVSTIWFVPDRHYYVGGEVLCDKHRLSDTCWNDISPATGFQINSIRGSGVNDVFAVGTFGEILHWNGVRWQSFRAQLGLTGGVFSSVSAHGNSVVAAGFNGRSAVVVRGTRR